MRNSMGPGVGVDSGLAGVVVRVAVGEAAGVTVPADRPGKAAPLQALNPRQTRAVQTIVHNLIDMLRIYPRSTGWLTRALSRRMTDCTSA
jgi:hypothetical protein